MQLADYLKELRKVKTLDLEEEQALWAAFKERGDEGARHLLRSSTALSTSSKRARSASSRRRSATTIRAAWPSACLPCTASAAA